MQIVHLGLDPDFVEYNEAWQAQREWHTRVAEGTAPDTILLLEHRAVFTAGRRTAAHERPWDGTPVVDVDRGGKFTWHGPGQLTGYPILTLARPIDVVAYVRRLESMMIAVCADFGVEAGRRDGQSGTWILSGGQGGSGPDRKIGAIGIRVARSVTMHGFALNCDNDLSWADRIIPCGIPDAGVTSLSRELGCDVPVREVLPVVERHLPGILG